MFDPHPDQVPSATDFPSSSYRRPALRVGLIGYGMSGTVLHGPLIEATDGLELAMIVTTNPDRQRRAALNHPNAMIVRDVDELLAHRPALDLVVIATANRSHVELATATLTAGLPTVVDKPLAPNPAQATALIELARRRRVLLTTFQNRRWDADFLTVRRLIDDEMLGTVQRFESRLDRWRPAGSSNWRERPGETDAGGILYDVGSHLIDQACQLFGPVHSAYAEVDRRREGTLVDDDTFVAITHHSGVRSHLWMSWAAPQRGPRFRVVGNKCVFVKFGEDQQEAELVAGHRPDRFGWGDDPVAQWGQIGTNDGHETVPTIPGAYPRFYQQLLEAILAGRRPPVDPSDSLPVLEVIIGARKAAGLIPADA